MDTFECRNNMDRNPIAYKNRFKIFDLYEILFSAAVYIVSVFLSRAAKIIYVKPITIKINVFKVTIGEFHLQTEVLIIACKNYCFVVFKILEK